MFGHAGAKVLVFPTRAARFHEYEDIGIVDALRLKIDAGHLQLFCVDSIDQESFYCYWAQPSGRIQRHVEYEQYILEEVLPVMHEKNSHPCVIAHGLSFGAFHAANIAFRHPQLFAKVLACSGRFDLTKPVEVFRDLFDGYYDETIYYHTPLHFLPRLECPVLLGYLRKMDIVLVVGSMDPFLESNEQLAEVLRSKDIPYRLHIWDHRAHNGGAWRRMVPHFL